MGLIKDQKWFSTQLIPLRMMYKGISKIQIAERQLRTAVELFLRDGDPVSIHTLTCAAQEILEVLAKKRGIKSKQLSAYEMLSETIDKKIVWEKMHEAKNAFKHANKDSNKITQFNPEYTECILWDAVQLYYFVTQQKIPTFVFYDLWFYSRRPEMHKLDPHQEAAYKCMIGEFTHRDKGHFLNMILDAENEFKKNIKPSDQIVNFLGKNFGPQVIEFDSDTKVWSSYFILNGQHLENPEEEFILNFYLNDIWAPEVMAEKVADIFVRNSEHIIGAPFIAPDNITNSPAYFIYSAKYQYDYGYVYITKISSFDGGVFSVVYSKKISGNGAKIQNNINEWLIKDMESRIGASEEISNIGVDKLWMDYFIKNLHAK